MRNKKLIGKEVNLAVSGFHFNLLIFILGISSNVLAQPPIKIEKPKTIHVKNQNKESQLMKKTYSKPSDQEIKQKLTDLQYKVTQKEGTERAFQNEYWDHKEKGIYVDIVSGEPLFSSVDKYDSGTGWPSFSKALASEHIVEKEDRKLFSVRIEVRSKFGDSHLGHKFDDGPPPTRTRYCINSAALRFIPYSRLEQEGYGEYLNLFDRN